MTEKLVELVRFDDPFKAEMVRLALGEHGIEAFIESAEANRAMHYVGTALGGVKVFVRDEQKARAEETLRSIDLSKKDENAALWICAACGEEVEPSFDECWSCGAARPKNAVTVARKAAEEETYTFNAEEDATDTGASEADGTNPYASPKTRNEAVPQASPHIAEAETIVLRAWRASVIGIVFCPFLLHIYSAYLLIDTRDIAPQLSEKCKRLRFWATMINMVMIALGLGFVFINAFDMWRVFDFHYWTGGALTDEM